MITVYVAHQMQLWAALPFAFLGHIVTDSSPDVCLLYSMQRLYEAQFTHSQT